ncbi:MAG: hypothetical protein U9R79_05555 [Armatimonadota bacterium]|nr:hypothetical protein [Armatimonadota bacterium]
MQESKRIFGAAVRRRYNLMLGLATFAAAAAPFGVGLALLHLLWPEGRGIAPFLVATAALILAPVGTWLAHNRLALAGNLALRRRLRELLREEGHDFPEGVRPIFVGFSPGDAPLVWDGDTDRDIGFLAAWGDALVYYGDDFSWYLPRARIDIIEPMQPAAGLNRILIRWHAPRESNRALTLVSREAADLRGARRATIQLLHQLYAWVARPPEAQWEPPRLGMPPTDTAGGRPMDAAPGGSCLALVAVVTATVVAAWQVGGPLVEAQMYAHAVLASGGVFVVGFAAISTIMRLLQWAEERDRADRAASPS